MATKERYNELVDLINRYNRRYHEEDDPEVEDYVFDPLNKELRDIEAEHPEWIREDSPTQQVGGKVKREAGATITHNVPMLSIQDVFTKEDVTNWLSKVREKHPNAQFSVEEKIDGLSMSLRYRNNRNTGKMELAIAESRGDGTVGQSLYDNAVVIPDVRQELDTSYPYLEIRGEVYMLHSDFDKFNLEQEELGKKLAANPRNLAAGTLRQLDPEIVKKRGLRMFIFNVQDGDKALMQSHTKGLDYLASLGIAVVPHKLCTTDEEVLAEIDRIGESRGNLAYGIDGAVVKIDQIEYRKDFPAGTKYSAGHIAYKYPPEEKDVEFTGIEVSVGRTGKLTPVGLFSPVRLCGTSVQRVTLNNNDYLKENCVGIKGVYRIFKAGEIIPRLKCVVKEPPEIFQLPDVCPVCGQPVVREKDTADTRCVNPSCPAQLQRTVAYFVSRDAMDIKSFGPSNVEQLINLGFIHNYADIYRLKGSRDELIEQGVLGKEKNTDKVLIAIEESKKNSAVQLLTALGIHNVGKSTAKDIIKHFNSIKALSEADFDSLVAIPDVGPTTAQSIIDFFSNDNNKAIMKTLAEAGVNMEEKKDAAATNKLAGETFCITGTLSTMGRKEAETLIEKNGGSVIGVSKKLKYLVVGEDAGSKLKKAQDLGITILTETEFLAMMNEE